MFTLTRQKIIIIVGILVIFLIVLMVLASRAQRNNNTTQIPTSGPATPTPNITAIIGQITVFPTFPNTPVGKLKQLHSVPQKYKDLTIQYKPRSDTFVIYYTGSRSTAEQTFGTYLSLNNVSGVKSYYISLDAVSVTLPPRGFQ